ncbi:MAG: phosphoribosylformylglycinamidine synthase subunit PurL [Planctomycetes bacterium]|nr:phosphoribosylformylglycinamidine synthase subunit PurL [Planctomycetota bacterium]
MTAPANRLYRIEAALRAEFPDPEDAGLRAQFKTLGLPPPERVRTARIYWIEGAFDETAAKTVARELFSDPVTETACVGGPVYGEAERGARRVEVVKKPGVMDPVVGSIRKALADRGLKAAHVGTGRKYLFYGNITDATLQAAGRRILANESIEELHLDAEAPVHRITGKATFELRRVPLAGLDDAALAKLSRDGCLALTVAEMRQIQAHYLKLKRDPTDVELETLAQTWSEHCRHKTLRGVVNFTGPGEESKRYENLLKETIVRATEEIAHPACLSVFKDNAGVVAFDETWALTFKAETHNHPSAIEPYGGAGTGIGGVIRDTLGTGLGAKPIANTDVFCFGLPDTPFDALPQGTLHPRRVMAGVVSGVRDYGNRMGIPTVNGAVHFDPRYVGNPLVYCGSIGLIPRNKIRKASQPGDLIVALGGRTGRDGIHGATFSSIELTHESETVSSGAVQIGNAIEEKKVLDVLMRARDAGLYTCVTDCGAGGFSSAVGEMGEETGADVDLDKCPLKYDGLTYTEIWISEAQERMVLAVPEKHWPALQAICAEEGVEATAIGRFTSDKILRLRYRGTMVGEIEMDFLHGGLPKVERQAVWKGPAEPKLPAAPKPAAKGASHGEVLKRILAHPSVASKQWIVRQYDHEVQGRTSIKPLVGLNDDGPGDAAVMTPVLGSTKGAAISNGICPQFTDLDPREMAKLAVDEALRNAVAVGGDPAQTFILDNFSWGNTSKPEQLGSLTLCCEGATEAAIAFGTPFISGKDSLNNEYAVEGDTIAIPGTLLISALSIVPDVRKCVTMDLKKPGNKIFILGETRGALGGSHYNLVTGRSVLDGEMPRVDLARAKQLYAKLHQCIKDGLVASCHDLSEGGLAVAAAEMAFAGDVGATLDLAKVPVPAGAKPEAAALLFGESPSRFLIEVSPANAERFRATFAGLPCADVGEVTKERVLRLEGPQDARVEEPVDALRKAWQQTF